MKGLVELGLRLFVVARFQMVGDFVPASALWGAKDLKVFINWSYGDGRELSQTGKKTRALKGSGRLVLVLLL